MMKRLAHIMGLDHHMLWHHCDSWSFEIRSYFSYWWFL